MVFGKLFGGGRLPDGDRQEGERLFQLGMQSAVAFRSNEALDYYTRSISASANPAPYINRANLLMKRIRHYEGRCDLEEAARLDAQQGREFTSEINRELNWAKVMSANYENGTRDKLIADLRSSDHSIVAQRIICASFDISQDRWDYNTFPRDLIEFHLFNDLDDLEKFDDLTKYPEAQELIEFYDRKFIEKKVSSCPDTSAYNIAQAKLHNFLCSYDLEDMVLLRRHMIYRIHDRLLAKDFGDLYDALDSDCNGIIREAEDFAG